jgi:hypothetical protein
MRHILVQICPHIDNSDIRVAMSVSAYVLEPLVGVGEVAEETLCRSLGKCDGSRQTDREGRESKVAVDSGKRTAPRGNKLKHIGDSISRGH